MKTVVITGSARGFGYAMLELFYQNNYNVVICDVNEEELTKAKSNLEIKNGKGKILSFKMDITNEDDIKNLINKTVEELGNIDIWINNAGVNQPANPIWELDNKVINRLIDIDLKGTVLCSKLIFKVMKEQGNGAIYNVEGHGSNDATITGLSIYGTSKRAVTYFTEALAHESADLKCNVIVGKITPGIMITNFLKTSLGDGEKIELDDKTKKIYNILGDYPETIAKFMVQKIINNTKNNSKFVWLSNSRAFIKFLTYPFKKTNYFEK
ncbi:MAG: SDR family oxidoreductase [Bacilli bacterium]|nr:SDR family oxidoreductase [Bacilli bacterium]